MSKSKNKRAVIVGIFIVVGVGLLIAIIMIMGGQRKSFARTITIKALFEDVSGLQQGNNIWLAGVKVGTVRNISFSLGRFSANASITESVMMQRSWSLG